MTWVIIYFMEKELLTEPVKKSSLDMSPEDFKKHGYQIIDWIAEYLKNIESYPVLSQIKPGDVKNNLPKSAPKENTKFENILNDFEKVIMPGITHWNSPNFFAYFPVTASGPGILGELLCAALNVNGMLWKTSPSVTELEEVSLSWLRQMLGISNNFFGIIYDTASISTMHAICAAREALNLKIRERGMAGRKDLLPLRLYTSSESHSSVEKAAITLGIGQEGVRKVAVDDSAQMDIKALVNLIEEDIKAGCIPFCVVATVGTTSTNGIDPVGVITEICKKYKMWLHIDAAYAGTAAIVPEMKYIIDGWREADSIVVNPHKWFFTPIDLSVLYCKKPEILKQAFSLVPEYLRTDKGNEVTNLMDYGIQLGRRFRALKLWMIMSYFGQNELVKKIREHIRIARELKKWIDEDLDFSALPVPFSTVCFRYFPQDLKELAKKHKGEDEEKIVHNYLNDLNEKIMNSVNATGKFYISHTKAQDNLNLRLSITNIRTTEKHVRAAWKLIQEHAKKFDKEMRKELSF